MDAQQTIGWRVAGTLEYAFFGEAASAVGWLLQKEALVDYAGRVASTSSSTWRELARRGTLR